MPKQDSKKPEVEATARVEMIDTRGTERSTMTIVEDRTEAPVANAAVEYEVIEHGVIDKHGTVLTTAMEPVGGRPEASE